MPNFASVLKEEIARLARKQARGEIAALKKASTQHRSDIAALKRSISALEQQLKRAGKAAGRKVAVVTEGKDGRAGLRFSAKGFGTLRKKLDISAADMALLLGVSGQSVYKWEDGKARPRASQLPAISAVRGLGKREVTAKLAELASKPAPKPKPRAAKAVTKVAAE